MVSITMPQLGESVTEGTVARWLKHEGDTVAKYEPIVEVITDKVNSEIPSPAAGVLARIVVPEGQTVKVGTEIAVLEAAAPPDAAAPEIPAGAAAGESTGAQGAEREAEQPPGAAAGALAIVSEPARESIQESGPKYTEDEVRRRSSPLVRRLAREHGIDLQGLTGSGAGGRVTKDDILKVIAEREGAPAAPAPVPVIAPSPAPGAAPVPPAPPPVAAPPAVAAPPPAAAVGADEEPLPLTPMRRAIAEHMVRSVTTAPHAWTYVEVDVSGLVKWRDAVRAEFQQRHGFALSFVPFFAKALVETLRGHPIMNSTWRDGQVVLKKRIHLGVAIGLDDGLIVPVIRDADDKSIAGLARALNDLVERARAGRLTIDDVQGGTFTLNNTGALGSILSQPIINQPQAAIITMEAITKRVVVTADDAIAIRPIMNVCLSFDHRICDGVQACRFLQSLKQRLEAMAPGSSIY